jgi:ankyrin repeat protein
MTPLFLAASKNHLEIVRFLLDRGAAINHRDCNGKTPLEHFLENGQHKEIVYLLVRAAAREGDTAGIKEIMKRLFPSG